jgi:hypothetical protein
MAHSKFPASAFILSAIRELMRPRGKLQPSGMLRDEILQVSQGGSDAIGLEA